MSKKPNDEANNERVDWMYWNRMPVLTLQQAIFLTLNIDPRPFDMVSGLNQLFPSRYHELKAIAQAHILNRSLKYLNPGAGLRPDAKKLQAVDWLQWLETIGITPPNEWRPAGFDRGNDSIDNENRYRPHYDEAVNIAIAMVESPDIPAPTKLKELYGYMENNPKECPVNYGAGKTPKTLTVEKNVRNGGGNPLQAARFLEVLAQNS